MDRAKFEITICMSSLRYGSRKFELQALTYEFAHFLMIHALITHLPRLWSDDSINSQINPCSIIGLKSSYVTCKGYPNLWMDLGKSGKGAAHF